MIENLSHTGIEHSCSICSDDYTSDEGGMQGYIGILPCSFCPTCLNGVLDMAEQLTLEREWEGLTDDELEEIELSCNENGYFSRLVFCLRIEAKLKEKNGL